MSGFSWVTDGSPELKISENGNMLQCITPRPSGEVYNAIYHDQSQHIIEGTHYWRVTVNFEDTQDSAWVGITDLAKFKAGWAFRGLMYGGPGNLSNGGALLVSRFGPKIKSGDIIGIMVETGSSKLQVSFDVNSIHLGVAFDLERNVLGEIIPAVRFGGNGNAIVEKLSNEHIPKRTTAHRENKDKVLGAWKLLELKGVTKLESIDPMLTLNEIPDEPNAYSGNLRVINNISFKLEQDPANGKWSHTHLRSTRVAGSPEQMDYETQVKELVTNPEILSVSNEGKLLINNKSSESSWAKDDSRNVVTQNPFN